MPLQRLNPQHLHRSMLSNYQLKLQCSPGLNVLVKKRTGIVGTMRSFYSASVVSFQGILESKLISEFIFLYTSFSLNGDHSLPLYKNASDKP